MPVEEKLSTSELSKEHPSVTRASPALSMQKKPASLLFPELSPYTPANRYTSLLTDRSRGKVRGMSNVQLVDHLQNGYGNRYTEKVITEYREKRKESLEKREEPVEAHEPKKEILTKQAKKPSPVVTKVKPPALPKKPPAVTGKKAMPIAKAPSPKGTEVLEGKPVGTKPLTAVTGIKPFAPETGIKPTIETETKPTPAVIEMSGEKANERPPAIAGGKMPALAVVEKAPAMGVKAEKPPTVKATPKKVSEKVKAGVEASAEKAVPGALPGVTTGPVAKRSPKSPKEDPAFLAVIARAKAVTYQQGHNNPAMRKAAEAQAAALPPSNEIASQAAAAQVVKMDAQEPRHFDKASFKASLLAKIAEITPQTKQDIEDFKKQGKAGEIKGTLTESVAESKENAQGAIKGTIEETPDTSVAEPKQVTPLPPTDAGPKPGDIGSASTAPKPKSESEISLEEGSQSLDKKMVESNITEEQLQKSNEPEFNAALESKKTAQTHAQEAPVAYRQDEQVILEDAQSSAMDSAGKQIQAMHESRTGKFGAIVSNQRTTKSTDEQKRAEIARHIVEIFKHTKAKVDSRISQLDTEVNQIFDCGAELAEKEFEDYVEKEMLKYKLKRYLFPGGAILWAKDKLLGPTEEENNIYLRGRDLYIEMMDAVIDKVATIVEKGLNEAKGIIAAGREEVNKYVATLPEDLRQVGEKAAENIQSEFDSLRESVNQKGTQLIDSLADKYVENLQKVDDCIKQKQEKNRSLIDKAKDKIGGIVETIKGLKEMLLGALSRAAGIIDAIIKDPIPFVSNLARGVKAGLDAFISNIGTHLKKGLMGWLFGTLAKAGIQLPSSFDLKGIISLVLQILGLTYANFRARAVAIVGEPIVSKLEKGAEIFRVFITEGVPGIVRIIKEKLVDLKTMIFDGIKSFLIEKVIVAGITWIIGLLNPASAFVKACKAIYDIIMFFVNRASQIMSLVNAVLDSLEAIVSGAIGAMASAIENALAKALPVAISFLASLLGIGGISNKTKKVMMKAQTPVNKAMDWAIRKAYNLFKKAGKALGLSKDKKDKEDKGKRGEYDDQIGKTVTFSVAGESHRLWIATEGPNATVMMSSNSESVLQTLDEYQRLATDLEEEKKNQALSLIGQAKTSLNQLDSVADELARNLSRADIEPSKLSKSDDIVEGGEDQLVAILVRIREVLGITDKQDPEIVKQQVASEVQQLPRSMSSVEELSSQLQQIFGRYQPKGLKKLYIRASGNAFEILAEASAAAVMDQVLSMHRRGTGGCFLIVQINDTPMGTAGQELVIWSGGKGRPHAEEKLVRLLPSLLNYYRRNYRQEPRKVDITIRFSPCSDRCTPVLLKLRQQHPEVEEWNVHYVELYIRDWHTEEMAMEAIKQLEYQKIFVADIVTAADMERIKSESE